MAESRATLLKQIKALQKEIADLSNSDIARQKELNKKIRETINALKELNKERLANASAEESSQKSLNGIYEQFSNQQKGTLYMVYAGQDKNQEAAYKVMDINRSIAQLSSEDEYQKLALLAQRDDAMGKLDGRSKGLIKNLKEQNSIANDFGNMSESHKQILEGQKAVLDGIKNTIQGTIDTAVTLYGNLQGAIGGVITGLGFVVDKIGDANKELGTTMFQTDGVARSAGVLSFVFEDAAQNAKDLSAELGDTGKASFDLQTNIGLMSKNMGISGTEATKLVGALSRLNDGSTDIASDMVATSREFAKQNGIIPAQLMGDLANSTEEFALFGKDGGKNILEAAGYAAKLGTNMSTLSGIADGLLDFETSITKELELGAMLGKNINLSKARELAYSGDIEGATKETLKQLGGVDAFNKMDYYQKKQTADLLGVSVAELQKMNQNMEQADTIGGVLNSKFSTFNEIVNAGVNSALGTTLKTLGGAVTAAAQMGGSFAQMGFDVKGMASKLPGIGKFFGGGGGAGAAGGGLTKAGKPDMRLKANKSPIGGKGSIMDGMSKINMSAVLKGAAAMVLVAGAVFIFGKAVQEFMKVSWSAVGMAVVSMLALVGAVALLGAIMMSGVGAVAILAGAAAMLVVASAVLVLGIGLQAIGTGFEMLGAGISTFIPILTGVASSIMGMVTMIAPIALLSYALFGLSAAMMGLGVSMAFLGIAGLPGLLMLAGIAAVSGPIIKMAGMLGIGGESEAGAIEGGSLSEYETNMLSKMDQLIQATSSQRDIFLDKDKVTNVVMDRGERSAVNKFSLNKA